MLIVNFKTYNIDTISLCKNLTHVICAPQLPYISEVVKFKGMIFSQHIDPYPPGKHTGSISPYELKKLGVCGSLINHSEKPMPEQLIKKSIKILRKLEMTSVLCLPTLKQIKKYAKLKPDYIKIDGSLYLFYQSF